MLSWQLLSSLVPLKGKFTGGKEREVKERRMNEKWIGNVTLWIGQPYPGKVGCLLVPHDPVTREACKNYNDWTSKKRVCEPFTWSMCISAEVSLDLVLLAMQSQSVNCFFLVFSLLSYSGECNSPPPHASSARVFKFYTASPVVLLKFLSCKW